jgi:hypothetical protein
MYTICNKLDHIVADMNLAMNNHCFQMNLLEI